MAVFDWLFLAGRILFSAVFVFSGLGHFMQLEEMSEYAGQKGVPAPKLMTVVTGVVILLGGLSILFWTQVIVGAWLLAGFLLLAAFTIHDFWAVEDPQQAQVEMQQFMKNLALAGAAIVFYVAVQTAQQGGDVVRGLFGG
jgi:uncharacterized membrane protein YphA (DoxX/SURF4 family)